MAKEAEQVSCRRIGIAFGIVSVGAAMSLLPVPPALASQRPDLCALVKSNYTASTKEDSEIPQALESGDWPSAQKALLAVFDQATQAEQEAVDALSNAPSSVRAAGAEMIRLASTEKKLIETATSATQLESGVSSAARSPRATKAEKTLSSYFASKCGTATSTP